MNELERLIEDYIAQGFTPEQAEWCARNDIDNSRGLPPSGDEAEYGDVR